MSSSPDPASTAPSAANLAPELIPDRSAEVLALAGAVRDLGKAREIGKRGCHALVRKMRGLFPELMELRGDHDAAVLRRQEQIEALGPFLLGIRPFIEDGPESPLGLEGETRDNLLDESARLMWELAVTEQEIEALHSREAALRQLILSGVSPEHLPLVRWALDQA